MVLRYVRDYVTKIEILKENSEYQIGNIRFFTARRHQHRVETYGLNFKTSPHTLSIIADTKFFPELPDLYWGEVLVIHVVRLKPIGEDPIDHLSIDDVKAIIKKSKPKLTLLTHFGMTMVRAKPWVVAEELEKELGRRVIAARDGMKIDLTEV